MIENAKIAPIINQQFTVTSPFGAIREGSNHKGLDISTGISGTKIYSLFSGIVVNVGYTDILGYYCIVRNTVDNIGAIYQHLLSSPVVLKNSQVQTGTLIGYMGSTGESTGVHLHLGMQPMNTNTWNFGLDVSEFINPAEYMGITNVKGTKAIYTGEIIENKRNSFKWILFNPRKR